jgi:hypothetical protein
MLAFDALVDRSSDPTSIVVSRVFGGLAPTIPSRLFFNRVGEIQVVGVFYINCFHPHCLPSTWFNVQPTLYNFSSRYTTNYLWKTIQVFVGVRKLRDRVGTSYCTLGHKKAMVLGDILPHL